MANKVTVKETQLSFSLCSLWSSSQSYKQNLDSSVMWCLFHPAYLTWGKIHSQAHILERLLIPAFFSPVFLHSVFQRPVCQYVLFHRISRSLSSWNLSLQENLISFFFFFLAMPKPRENTALWASHVNSSGFLWGSESLACTGVVFWNSIN